MNDETKILLSTIWFIFGIFMLIMVLATYKSSTEISVAIENGLQQCLIGNEKLWQKECK